MARDNRVSARAILKVYSMNGIYNLGLEKFLSSLGMRGFVGGVATFDLRQSACI